MWKEEGKRKDIIKEGSGEDERRARVRKVKETEKSGGRRVKGRKVKGRRVKGRGREGGR